MSISGVETAHKPKAVDRYAQTGLGFGAAGTLAQVLLLIRGFSAPEARAAATRAAVSD